MERKNPKKFSVLNIIAFESGTTNSLNLEQDTCHWESTCYELPLIFNISLGEIFLMSSFLRVIKNMMNVLSSRLDKSLASFNMLTVKACSKTVFLREWSNQVFHSR